MHQSVQGIHLPFNTPHDVFPAANSPIELTEHFTLPLTYRKHFK